MTTKVTIHRLNTGVPGLDDVLGGGLPEFSFNLIAGPPGCGADIVATRIQVLFGYLGGYPSLAPPMVLYWPAIAHPVLQKQ